jgi:hypothetical protein
MKAYFNYGILIIVFGLFFSLAGCALVEKAKGNYEACWSDYDCHQKMIKNSQMAKEIGQVAGSATGFPIAGTVAGSVLATLGLILTGVVAGAKLSKKQEVVK